MISRMLFYLHSTGVYFNSQQVAKITACYSRFAGCSTVCPCAHVLCESQYGRLFSKIFLPVVNVQYTPAQ